MKKIFNRIPKHTYIPLAMMAAFIVISYDVTRLFNSGSYHYNVAIPLDSRIPFIPAFVVVYVLAFAQWVITAVLAAREGKDFYFKASSSEIMAKLVAIPIFLVFPTIMVRPEIQGGGVFDWMTRFIYACDVPDNLFPSLHCLESWVCLRLVCAMKKVPSWYKWANAAFSLLVFASVVLVKQHLILDIPGGIVVAEIGFLLGKWLKTERIMYRIVPQRWQN